MAQGGLALVALIAGAGLLLATRRERSPDAPASEPVEPGPGEPGEPGSASPEPDPVAPGGNGSAPSPDGTAQEPVEETPVPIPDPVNPGQLAWLEDHMDLLPPHLQDINFSGLEDFEYRGTGDINGRNFHMWKVRNSLNGYTMDLYVQSDNGRNYVSAFELPANVALGIPARLDFHAIHGETQVDRDWLSVNILDFPEGSFKRNVPDIAGRFF